MLNKAATILVALLVVGLIAISVVMTLRLHASERENHAFKIQHANDSAALDSTVRVIRQDGDNQLAIARRLAFQTAVEVREVFQDSIKRIGTAMAQIRIERDSLHLVVADTAIRDSLGTLIVADSVDRMDSLGVAVATTVRIQTDLAATWDYRIYRAALPLEVLLTCEGDLAVAQVAGPVWAVVVIDSVAQDPDICIPAPQFQWKPLSLSPPSMPWAIVLLAVGVIVGRASP